MDTLNLGEDTGRTDRLNLEGGTPEGQTDGRTD